MGSYLDLNGLRTYTTKVINWDQYAVNLTKAGTSNSSVYISSADAAKLSDRHPLIVNLNWMSTSTSSTCGLYIRNGSVDSCTGQAVDLYVCSIAIRTKDKTSYSTSDRGLLIPIKGSNTWSLLC